MIHRFVSVAALGFAAFKTFKVVSHEKDKDKAKEWLRFWVVVAYMHFLGRSVWSRIEELNTLIILWQLIPANGAAVTSSLFENIASPSFERLEDFYVNYVEKQVASLQSNVCTLSRVAQHAVLNWCMDRIDPAELDQLEQHMTAGITRIQAERRRRQTEGWRQLQQEDSQNKRLARMVESANSSSSAGGKETAAKGGGGLGVRRERAGEDSGQDTPKRAQEMAAQWDGQAEGKEDGLADGDLAGANADADTRRRDNHHHDAAGGVDDFGLDEFPTDASEGLSSRITSRSNTRAKEMKRRRQTTGVAALKHGAI
eukprot:g844.t1